MNPLSLLNPWVLLGLLAAFLAVAGGSYVAGEKSEHTAVMAAWDAAEKQRAWESQKNVERVRETEGNLQAKADAERKANENRIASLNARVERLNGELQQRASRPTAPAASGAQAPGLGATGSTGLGLYREDGLFLVGEASTGRLIQLQRDECYRAYEAAQAALAKLQATP